MGPLTADRPKCLLDVYGQPSIDRQVTSLRACGVRHITVVVGYRGAQIKTYLSDRVRYVENVRYRDTNSLYSLWLARDALVRGALVLNADVLAPTLLIDRLLRSPAEDAVLVALGRELGPEEMKVKLQSDLVVDFGKDLAPADTDGENVGIAKFGAEGGRRLLTHLGAEASAQRKI
jgi:choline kinase